MNDIPLLKIGYFCSIRYCHETFAGLFKSLDDAIEQPKWALQAGWSYHRGLWYCPAHLGAQVDAMLLDMSVELALPGD